MTTSPKNKRTIIITGASNGIGKAAARALSKENHVVIVGRSSATKNVAEELGIDYYRADYSNLTSVKKLATDLLKKYPKIDFLINNAGGVMGTIQKTDDGFESTIQVNYFAQFLLTHLLLDRIIASKGAIVNTSSGAHMFSFLKIDDIQAAKSPTIAYGNSKLLDLIHAKEITRRYKSKGIDAVSFHPGIVATNFASSSGNTFSFMANGLIKKLIKTPEQGADTLVWLVNNRPLWKSGAYYVKRKPAMTNRIAKDTQKHKIIWDNTEKLLGLTKKVAKK
jgi:NAD(P)-dependent dehydrogenase (short-subunit alcohol dehydrogenase family)